MESRKSFLLRINGELWKEIEGWAQAELRSVNGQVEYLLRQAVLRRRVPKSDALPPPEPLPETASPSLPTAGSGSGEISGTDLEVGKQD